MIIMFNHYNCNKAVCGISDGWETWGPKNEGRCGANGNKTRVLCIIMHNNMNEITRYECTCLFFFSTKKERERDNIIF